MINFSVTESFLVIISQVPTAGVCSRFRHRLQEINSLKTLVAITARMS